MPKTRSIGQSARSLHLTLGLLLAGGAPAALPQHAHAGTTNTAATASQPADERAPWQTDCPEGRDPTLWAFLDQYVKDLHQMSPGIGSTLGDDSRNHLLGDSSAAAIQQSVAWSERMLAALQAIDRTGFSEHDHLDADLLLDSLSRSLAAAPLKQWQMPISTLSGPQVWLPQMGQRSALTTDKHFSDYVSKLSQVETLLTDTMENMRLGMAEGRVPPRVTLAPTVEQAMAQATPSIREDPTTSLFYGPLNQLPAADPRRAQAARIISDQIVPAYIELAQFLQNEYIPAARDSVGIAQGIDGVKAYDIALRNYTTLPLTTNEVHQQGLEEVARIKAEMMEVIARTDWVGSDKSWPSDEAQFAAFVEFLRTDSRFYYDDPEDLLAEYRNISKLIDAEMPKLFRTLPRLSYGVRVIPPFAAKAAPTAYYYPGSLSEGVPGYFMANTSQLDNRPTYDMIALTLHEAVPGHHHQIALAQELEGQHPVRKLMGATAFSEGWALYAERLGLEVGADTVDDGVDRGLYADPYDDFGRLNYEMWRAMRLVVDSGLHAMGWTRQQALDYFLANSALTEVNVRNEIDRYIGWPGQATAYKIGELKIRELRARAEAALGEAFDLRSFHDAVLENGSIPLPVLESRMDRWIAEQGG